MKRLLTACLLGSLAFAVSAQDASEPQVDNWSEADAKTEDRDTIEAAQQPADISAEATLDTEAQTQADADRNCIRFTGSRIPSRRLKSGECVNANGRVYSSEDLKNTGETDMAEALRRLDPSIY